MDTVISILKIIIAFLALIVGHEFGHYLAARWCGIRVKIFSIGFGRTVLSSHDSKGTLWRVAAWPLGGYVLLDEFPHPEQAPLNSAYYQKAWWQKCCVIIAGPIANLVMAWLLLLAAFLIGIQSYDTNINRIIPGSIAAESGLPAGHVIAINGTTVDSWMQLGLQLIRHVTDEEITITMQYQGTSKTYRLPLANIQEALLEEPNPVKALGIEPNFEKTNQIVVQTNIQQAVIRANHDFLFINELTGHLLYSLLITGKLSVSNLAGPLVIIDSALDAIKIGAGVYLFFLSMLSINLAIMNSIPLPGLDGGRLVLTLIETLSGKLISQRLYNLLVHFTISLGIIFAGHLLANDVRNLLHP